MTDRAAAAAGAPHLDPVGHALGLARSERAPAAGCAAMGTDRANALRGARLTRHSAEHTALAPRSPDDAGTTVTDSTGTALHPLSANQEQMLVLWSIDKQGNTYNMPHVQHFDDALDPDALRRCLLALVERHQVLRTHIVQDEATGTPMQRVRPRSEVSLSVLEVIVVDETEEEEQKMKEAVAQAQAKGGRLKAVLEALPPGFFSKIWSPWPQHSLLQTVAAELQLHVRVDTTEADQRAQVGAHVQVVQRELQHAAAAFYFAKSR